MILWQWEYATQAHHSTKLCDSLTSTRSGDSFEDFLMVYGTLEIAKLLKKKPCMIPNINIEQILLILQKIHFTTYVK